MPTNGNTPILDLQYNVDYDIEILGYKTGENNYGPWHFYQLRYNGEKYGHFAQPVLHEKLSRYNRGDRITIQKQQTEKDGYEWIVNGYTSQQEPVPVPISSTWDERTHDIHRQVCLKVAVMSFPASDRSWEAGVVDELKRRTNSLMTVLEGVQDDLPF